MIEDPKTDFYLANRALIEEWAALRPAVASALDLALLRHAHHRPVDGGSSAVQVKEDRLRHVWVDCTTGPGPHTWIGLSWEASTLLAGAGGWPNLIIGMSSPASGPVRDALLAATAPGRDTHGLTQQGKTWVRYGPVTPPSEPIVIEEYAQYCLQRLRDAWSDLGQTVQVAVQGVPGPGGQIMGGQALDGQA